MLSSRVLVLCSGLFLLGALDCGTEPTPGAGAPAEKAEPAKKDGPADEAKPQIDRSALARHMQKHQAYAGALQQAVIRGDLEAARAPAKSLAEHETDEDLPEILVPQLEAMRKLAAEIEKTDDAEAAARSLGAMATTCGGCHTVAGIEPDFPELPDPSSAKTPAAHMQRHVWATTEMWMGLIGPDEVSWTRGARRLDEAPLGHDQLVDEAVDIPEGISEADHETIATLREKVHGQSKKALKTTSLDQRGQIYGELVSTCAPCHAIMGKGPGFEDTP